VIRNQGAIYRFFTRRWDEASLRHAIREAFQVAEKMAH
jgi:hypothetical protein